MTGECTRPNSTLAEQDGTENTFKVDVTVSDDWGLDVRLITGPSFGCVHFETV